jgi:hypothetical protein
VKGLEWPEEPWGNRGPGPPDAMAHRVGTRTTWTTGMCDDHGHVAFVLCMCTGGSEEARTSPGEMTCPYTALDHRVSVWGKHGPDFMPDKINLR